MRRGFDARIWCTCALRRMVVFLLGLTSVVLSGEIVFENRFERDGETDGLDPFFVLSGNFSIQDFENRRCLELSAAPLGEHGLLFGPRKSGRIRVSTSVFAESKGRRRSDFGFGAFGVGGFRCVVSGAKQRLFLFRGKALLAEVTFSSQGGQWLRGILECEPGGDGRWLVRAKIWPESKREPNDWNVEASQVEAPPRGRATLWGIPFAERPIRFDDLTVELPDFRAK